MSYQVLARKWRPRSFDTLVGQEHVVKALSHALDSGRLHHAYLFTGTRGVGKTTIARILAKSLNCETGVSSKPCGVCSSCVEIDGGRFVDLIEVDAATNTKVDQMRDLLDNAVYSPTRGRYKVFVIDEVHMLSNSAFNAMLKTLEEPPEHIKFILATTDPQKIPVTVLSRCLQFNLKQMPLGHIVTHMTSILAAEGIPGEPAAMRHLAKAAAGSMRDGLSLLDQAIAHGAGKVEEAGVRDMLGTVGDDYLYGLLDGLAAGDVQALLGIAEQMDERSLSFDSALQELATLFHRIALLQFAPDALADDGERARLAPYAQRFDAEFLQLCYQIAVNGREQLPLAPDEYAGFSMTLLRLFAFRPTAAPGLSMSLSTSLPTGPTHAVAPVSAAVAAAKPAVANVTTAIAVAAVQPLPIPVSPISVAASTTAALTTDWHGIVGAMSLSGLARQLAQHCELAEVCDAAVNLRLAPAHKHLLGRLQQDKLQAELQSWYQRAVKLNIMLADAEGETPVERQRGEQRERQDRAIAAIEQDGFVRDVVDMFDATIDEASIKPV
jgi:DNA polymerase-3 subunit gamma/tau